MCGKSKKIVKKENCFTYDKKTKWKKDLNTVKR